MVTIVHVSTRGAGLAELHSDNFFPLCTPGLDRLDRGKRAKIHKEVLTLLPADGRMKHVRQHIVCFLKRIHRIHGDTYMARLYMFV